MTMILVTHCAVVQLAMNPLQQRVPCLLRKVRKSKRSGDYSSHQSIGAPHFKELQNPPVHTGTPYFGECKSP